MPIIGGLIKKAIELTQPFNEQDSPIHLQRQQLKKLLQKASTTSFGLFYGFATLSETKDPIQAYQAAVPVFDYPQMRSWWEQQQKYPHITWPGKPDFFALSSGTTGKESKRIPVTDDMLQSFRNVSLAQVQSLQNFDLPPTFFEKQILALGSSTDLKPYKGHLEGEISGINASNAPDWFDLFYKPGKEIAQINDWDQRLAAIVTAAPDWDIGALAGIPSWVLMMLKAIVEEYQLTSIHELWPDLQVYTTGGVAFEPYRESFEELFDRKVHFMDTYLASEGYFAFNARPGTEAMQLALQQGMFYEFIPFDETGSDESGNLLENPVVKNIEEVEAEKDYALLVSTPAGTYRYLIGDTVKFTDVERCEILITGRTKYFLNVVGSQLSEEKLNSAIQQLSQEMGVAINEFSVAALKDENDHYYHQWIVGTENALETNRATELLDQYLQELNKNYRVARQKALKYVQLEQVHKEDFYEWLEANKKKGGQIKVPKVMSAKKMREFVSFLER